MFNFKKMTRRMRVFYKSMAITMLTVVVLVIVGAIFLNQVTTPPDQLEVIPGMAGGHQVDEDGFLVFQPGADSDNTNTDNNDNDNDNESLLQMYNAPSWAEDRRAHFWTFLIVGLNEGTNANTVMVASYCGVTREANLISIPRDVPVHPTRNGRRLSSSYIIGHNNGGGMAGGVRAMQRDVQTIIGFIPDFYVVIDYDTFFTIIDAVGGIYIDVPIRMFYTDPFQNLRIDFQPGLQHMNSRQALEFSRFRQGNRGFPDLPGGDLGRVQSQQAVINAVIRELLRPASLLQIPTFINIFNESVYTDIGLEDLPFFAGQLNHIRRTDDGTDALSTYTFETRGGMVSGVSYQFLIPSNVVELVNRTINPFDQDISAADLRIIGQ